MVVAVTAIVAVVTIVTKFEINYFNIILSIKITVVVINDLHHLLYLHWNHEKKFYHRMN